MVEKIQEATKRALSLLDAADLPAPLKTLIKQLTNEIGNAMEDGDWELGAKLSSYRHEFAKLHGSLDWYPVFIEIRKIRDTLALFRDTKRLPG